MSSSPEPTTPFGWIRGRYRILRKLGSGTFGTVYLAEDSVLDRSVALKVLRLDRMQTAVVARLQEEFLEVSSLRHPGIAQAYDFGYVEDSGCPFYTCEYIQGESLSPGPPTRKDPPREFLAPILDLLEALGYLHSHDLFHLDVHAGNLIVAADASRGSVLIDPGFSRSIGGRELGTCTGPEELLPPEFLAGGNLNATSDTYMVGRLLHYRLTGRRTAESRLPREIADWGPRLTLDLERIVARATRRHAKDRFQTTGEFRDALRAVLGEAPNDTRNSTRRARDVLLGRDRELKLVEEALRDSETGRSSVLRFCGPSGRGKTRLLRECRLRAQLRGLEVVDIAFSAEPDSTSNLEESLRLRLQQGKWLAALDIRHGGTPADRARRAAESYFGEPGSPLVLLLDNLDAADDSSRLLVDALTDGGRADPRGPATRSLVLCITTTREQPRREASCGECYLKPLSSAAALRLLEVAVAPLPLPRNAARRWVAQAEGHPETLQGLGKCLREEFASSNAISDTARVSLDTAPRLDVDPSAWARLHRETLTIAETLAVADRWVAAVELEDVLELTLKATRRGLRQLARQRLVTTRRQGRRTLYRLSTASAQDFLQRRLTKPDQRRLHGRFVACLQGAEAKTTARLEHIARHLLAADRVQEAVEAATRVAPLLQKENAWERAARLFEDVAAKSTLRTKYRLAELESEIFDEVGAHQRGVRLLEPFCERKLFARRSREAVRLRRRLGVHCHRAGDVERAFTVFKEAQALASPGRDGEELTLIDSELAEMHLLRGSMEAAEEACLRGLGRNRQAQTRSRAGTSFSARMEMVLRASLGHLYLRRLELPESRLELRAALALSPKHGTTAERAAVLTNLGICENQLNRFAAARDCFRRAEVLLRRSGERRGLIKIATNLAVINAKMGARDAAHREIERAEQLSRQYPGPRLEFFLAYSRGLVAHQFADTKSSIRELGRALKLGKDLADEHLVGYGEVYLAESLLASGRYGQASRQLEATGRRATEADNDLLTRMVASRTALLAALMGRDRLLRRSRSRLESTPRTPVALPESWNDLFAGAGLCVSGATAAGTRLLRDALRHFRELDLKAPARLAELALAVFRSDARQSIAGSDEFPDHSIEDSRAEESQGAATQHAFLAVALPLLRAVRAFASSGDDDSVDQALSDASSAIVGSPFLELDWQIELLRGRVALRRGRLRDARLHIHRALHTRDLILQHVPARSRARFVAAQRFRPLADAARRLERSPELCRANEKTPDPEIRGDGSPADRGTWQNPFEDMVGRSAPMGALFASIERLRDQALPVLIGGETGTGKELVARALHRRSTRSGGGFFALHCGSLPPELFESELFGYEQGAFTEAVESRAGIVENVQGGTLLLDEIGALALPVQAKLLRFLDSGEFRRLGGRELRHSDVRIVASSSEDLQERVDSGTFRSDLYFRLRSVELIVPPLRERAGDIAELVRGLLHRATKKLQRGALDVSQEAIDLLRRYDWPGNVRELETILFRLSVELPSHRTAIEASDVTAALAASGTRNWFDSRLFADHDIHELTDRLHREYLTDLFRRSGGNPQTMMEQLGLKRTQLYAWFKRVGLEVRDLRREFGADQE